MRSNVYQNPLNNIDEGIHMRSMIVIGLVVLALLFGFLFGKRVEGQDWANRWNAQQLAWQTARADAETKQRAIEAAYSKSVEEVEANANKQIQIAQADARSAATTIDSLRKQAKQYAASRGVCQGAQPASGGGAADTTCGVLAELFSEAIQEAGDMAAAYDQARVAGLACEATYGSIIGVHQSGASE
jgi:hypothetical protein